MCGSEQPTKAHAIRAATVGIGTWRRGPRQDRVIGPLPIKSGDLNRSVAAATLQSAFQQRCTRASLHPCRAYATLGFNETGTMSPRRGPVATLPLVGFATEPRRLFLAGGRRWSPPLPDLHDHRIDLRQHLRIRHRMPVGLHAERDRPPARLLDVARQAVDAIDAAGLGDHTALEWRADEALEKRPRLSRVGQRGYERRSLGMAMHVRQELRERVRGDEVAGGEPRPVLERER